MLGWRTAFSVVGWWAIALAGLIFFALKETGSRAAGKSFMQGLRFIVRNRDLMLMAFAGFCLMWIQIGFISFGYVKSFAALAAIACGLGFLNGYANTFVPLIVSDYSGVEWAASAGGVAGTIFQIASILGPVVMGLSIDMTGIFTWFWWLLAAGPLAGIFLLLPMRKPRLDQV